MSDGNACLLLLVWVVVFSACAGNVVDTSTPEQVSSLDAVSSSAVETTSSIAESSVVPSSIVRRSPPSLRPDSLVLSPAWVEAEEFVLRHNPGIPDFLERSINILENVEDEEELAKVSTEIIEEFMEFARPFYTYWLENPNVIESSAMGALCWVYHEMSRAYHIEESGTLDDDGLGEILGLDYLWIGMERYGYDIEWDSAVRSALRPDVQSAVNTDEDLPPPVRLYAENLFEEAQYHIEGGQTYRATFYKDLPGYHSFVDAAKYSPDCLRMSAALDEFGPLPVIP